MNCETARMLFEFDRKAEQMPPSEADGLRAHCAECPVCAAWTARSRNVDDVLGRAMRVVPVPDQLSQRILSKMGSERRRVRQRRWLRSAAGLAAAAAILLAVWAGLDWQARRPVRLDLDYIGNQAFVELANPSAESVEGSFREKGVELTAPRDLNYRFFRYHGFAELQGKRVPFLLFVRDRDQARVYILDGRQFDVADALNHSQSAGSGCKAVVLREPTDRRFAYLVVHTGDALDPFVFSDKQLQ